MTEYFVRYTQDESGYWQATVLDVPGCHTQAPTREEAQTRIREALSLFVADASNAKLSTVDETFKRQRRSYNK